MVSAIEGTSFRSATSRPHDVGVTRVAFDAGGAWIGTVSSCGAVYDIDGVQIGVAWPNGEVYDLHGALIGRA